ncbi:MAG: hypothetical protein IJ374_06430 [Lachnospiraceae bacterium]|nr:hypothetical protein [Lachnospiraceae bacterium]
MREFVYAAEAPKIRPLSGWTRWTLNLLGRLDSRHGADVCNDFISGLYDELIKMESRELECVVKTLHPLRTDAVQILNGQTKRERRLEHIPAPEAGELPEVIRTNKRNMERRRKLLARIGADEEKLISIYEDIVDVHTMRDERINRMRSLTAEKVRHYVKGVRHGKLHDYQKPEYEFDDSAREIYKNQYDEQDALIRQMVFAYKETVNDEESIL